MAAPSLKVDSLAVRALSAKQDAQLQRLPPKCPKSQQGSIDSPAKLAETPKSFVLTCSSLAGSAVTVQASRKDSCSGVQEQVAAELNLLPYRIAISSEHGLILKGDKTLEECDIIEDADLTFVIAEADRWREMSRDQFIELVVKRGLGTKESLLRSLQSLPEKSVRQRYIPHLESIEKAEELKRQHEEHRQHLQSSIVSEARAMLSKLGVRGAVGAIEAKIVDVEMASARTVEELRAIKDDAQRDLDEALPLLRAAEHTVQSVTKADMQEVKSFTRPPASVTMVGEAMCLLFEVKPNWESTRKLWSDPQILSKMLNYDKDHIDPQIITRLDQFIRQPEFSPEVVGRVSRAARTMCMWVCAMHTYDRIARVVLPKKAKLMETQEDLMDAELELKLWRKQLEEAMAFEQQA